MADKEVWAAQAIREQGRDCTFTARQAEDN